MIKPSTMLRPLHVLVLGSYATMLQAQSLAPQVVGSAGASSALPGGGHVSWTVGEPVLGSAHLPGAWITQGFHQSDPAGTRVHLQMILEGPFVSATGLMKDDLRIAGVIPLSEPFTALGFPQVNSGGETIAPVLLTLTGSSAVVDWVHIQLRSASSNTLVVASANGVLRRDGSVTGVSSSTDLGLLAPPGSYHVAVFHRNHLGVMTALPVSLGPVAVTLDFRDATLATYGTDARKAIGPIRALWAGDASGNGSIAYTGAGNDRDPILVAVGSNDPNNVLSGQYRGEDVNMDAVVKYTGLDNDRDPILVNVGGFTPNNVRIGQVP